MHIASIGIDLGKTTFHLVALGERSKVQRSRRKQIVLGLHEIGVAERATLHVVKRVMGKECAAIRYTVMTDEAHYKPATLRRRVRCW
jgi:hypothetical protein